MRKKGIERKEEGRVSKRAKLKREMEREEKTGEIDHMTDLAFGGSNRSQG